VSSKVEGLKKATLTDHVHLSLSFNSNKEKDLEANDDDDDFDLLEYLTTTTSEASQAGIKRKRMGVTWTDLEVLGAASMNLSVKTFPDALLGVVTVVPIILAQLLHIPLFKQPSRKLLQNFNGSLRPGEMCLVIGRPNSGCSTFLKTIANQRSGFMGVNGEVLYGGLSSDVFTKKYRGEVSYCEEDDMHMATLSVEQTLSAALRLKSPGKKLPGENEKAFRDRVLTMMLKMLNIEHTRGTKVGSAFVRGVSGGERKRVSIAEVLCTRACVLSWDNASRGLDASTALDYAKSMRLLTNILGLSTFISLYQAGEGIWEQFDKVLVLDEGRCVYSTNRSSSIHDRLGFQRSTSSNIGRLHDRLH
jgi:ATP-binding cassette subfamily G (WHITE) protein 2 (SNQ2)